MTRHRFDPFSFIAGAFAAALAVAVLVGRVTIDLLDLRIAGPLLLLVLGLSLLLGGGRDRPLAASEPTEPTEPTERTRPGDTDDAERATEEVTEDPPEAADDDEQRRIDDEQRRIDDEASEA